MVFSGIFFIMYFLPFFLLGYYLIPQKLKNNWVAIASLLFYAWGAPVYLFFALTSSILDFFIGKKLKITKKKSLLFLGVGANVGLLVYFKYFNFFVDNLNGLYQLLGIELLDLPEVLLPIGISFLTFQKISYLIDVYREECDPQTNFLNYTLFIFLFPQLIAGPIVRYKDIASQILKRKYSAMDNFYNGFAQFVLGLTKKVLLANVFGSFVNDQLTGDFSHLGFIQSWFVLFAYTFQIYFDFSGYSDMAIGLGRILGFNIPENFKFPYLSKSITEFWRRWHITLGTWMKDYLYFPLGGNRKGELKTYRNLFIVFSLSGIWHGASWMFLFWGIYHGLFLVIERLFLGKLLKKALGVNMIYTFLVVSIGWVGFRLESLLEAELFLRQLFSFETFELHLPKRLTFLFLLVLAFHLFGIKFESQLNNLVVKTSQKGFWIKTIMVLILFVLCLGELYGSGFNPFIYFKF